MPLPNTKRFKVNGLDVDVTVVPIPAETNAYEIAAQAGNTVYKTRMSIGPADDVGPVYTVAQFQADLDAARLRAARIAAQREAIRSMHEVVS